MNQQPVSHFKVVYRNVGHWDFVSSEGRLFRLRGTPGNWLALDERAAPYPTTKFKSFDLCMAFICSELTHEELEEDATSPGNNRTLAQPTT